MNGWETFTTLLSGLVAVVLLAGSVALARERGDELRTTGLLRMLSAAGLTATLLFGIGLIHHLIVQVVQSLK